MAWALLPVSLWLTFRYRWVLDDAFIYFRYAENFARTGQLVFNVGEYTEGFTSPLWMLLLATTRALGLPFWPVVMTLSFACVVAFHWLLRETNDALSPAGAPAVHVYLPSVLLGTNYAVLSHFGSGLETPLVQVCAAAFACSIVVPSSRLAQLLMAVAPLVRPELALPFAVSLLWGWWKRRAFPRLLGLGGGGLGAAWLVFRIGYYGDVLPNTYYLKVGDHWSRGVTYLSDTVMQYHFWVWLIVLFVTSVVVSLRRPEGRLPERAVIWAGAGLVAVHVVRIGGDFVHYRTLAFPLCAVFASFGGVAESVLQRLSRRGLVVGPLLAVASSVAMVAEYPRRQLPTHPLRLGRHDLGIFTSLDAFSRDDIEDSMRHRSIDLFLPERWDVRAGTSRVPPRYGEILRTGLCADAYQRMDAYVIHDFGLTSAVLARLPIPEGRHAGHKWGLRPYAADLQGLYGGATRRPTEDTMRIQFSPGRGAFRRAASTGRAPVWVMQNLEALELLERKSYDRNDPWSAVRLAFTRPRLVL